MIAVLGDGLCFYRAIAKRYAEGTCAPAVASNASSSTNESKTLRHGAFHANIRGCFRANIDLSAWSKEKHGGAHSRNGQENNKKQQQESEWQKVERRKRNGKGMGEGGGSIAGAGNGKKTAQEHDKRTKTSHCRKHNNQKPQHGASHSMRETDKNEKQQQKPQRQKVERRKREDKGMGEGGGSISGCFRANIGLSAWSKEKHGGAHSRNGQENNKKQQQESERQEVERKKRNGKGMGEGGGSISGCFRANIDLSAWGKEHGKRAKITSGGMEEEKNKNEKQHQGAWDGKCKGEENTAGEPMMTTPSCRF